MGIKTKLKKYSGYLIIFLLIFLIFSLARNILKFYEIRKQIEKGRESVANLKKENEDLSKKLAETQSQESIEKQLRNKLGLAKSGEIVVVLPDEEILKKLAPQAPEEEDALPDPTWKKWLKLFF